MVRTSWVQSREHFNIFKQNRERFLNARHIEYLGSIVGDAGVGVLLASRQVVRDPLGCLGLPRGGVQG